MTKNDLLTLCYTNNKIIAYCKTVGKADWEELKSQLIIQLVKMPEIKIQQAYKNDYLEYMCFVICKRIIAGNVPDSGEFYRNKNNLSLSEGWGLDVASDSDVQHHDNGKLDIIEDVLRGEHWYNKILFNYYFKDGYNLREISEITGIHFKSINYAIIKTKTKIKKHIQTKYGNNNNIK
jgi:hypothetical protein